MRLLWLVLAAALPAFGQLDNDTITVTASRVVNLQPDQAVISVSVTADQNAAIDDVVALISAAGVTVEDLQYVNNGPTGPDTQNTTWTFNHAVPFDKLKDTLVALLKAQQGLPENSGTALSYDVVTTQVSQALQKSQECVYGALVSDARRQAQAVAGVAGLGVGAVVGLSQGQGALALPAVVFNAWASYSLYAYAGDQWFSRVLIAPVPATCSMTVQFRVVR